LFGVKIDVFDPIADRGALHKECNINLIHDFQILKYDSIILAVSHSSFHSLKIKDLKKSDKSIVFDIKSFLDRSLVDGRL
jgi:UDP-N-acetyl-D-galactosamine dehydrogenase